MLPSCNPPKKTDAPVVEVKKKRKVKRDVDEYGNRTQRLLKPPDQEKLTEAVRALITRNIQFTYVKYSFVLKLFE